jgi:cell division ATPase FtsA
MSFLKKENKSSPFIVFDIGSASVGAAIALVPEEEQIPQIIYNTRAPIVAKNSHDSSRFLLAMLSALKTTAINIERDGIRKLSDNKLNTKDIKNVFCVLSSSWHKSSIEVFKLRKEKPFIVSSKFISNMIKNADEQFLKSIKNQSDNKKIVNPKVIEKNIIKILLNGYNTNEPNGKKVNNIDVVLFMSIISGEVLEKIESILEKIFSVKNISFHTFTLSAFSVVRDIFSTEENFLLMDISGETTSITLVRNETIVKDINLPLGKNFLIEKVASSLNTVYEEAHSLIRLFLEGKSINTENVKIEKILKDVREEWLSSFRKVLSDFSEGLSLPKTIFLTIDTDIGKWFVDTIKSDEFSIHTLAEQPFTIVELSSRILSKHCLVSQENLTGCDIFLSIDVIFANKIVNK